MNEEVNRNELLYCSVMNQEEKHCEEQPDKVVNTKVGELDLIFCFCERHARGLDEGKTFIVQDLKSKNYFQFELKPTDTKPLPLHK